MRAVLSRTVVGADPTVSAAVAQYVDEDKARHEKDAREHSLLTYLALGSFAMTAIQFVYWAKNRRK